MENFDQIFTLLAENEGITLNLDILETGVAVYRENREIFVKIGPFPTNVTEGVVMVKNDTERWVVDPSQVFTRWPEPIRPDDVDQGAISRYSC